MSEQQPSNPVGRSWYGCIWNTATIKRNIKRIDADSHFDICGIEYLILREDYDKERNKPYIKVFIEFKMQITLQRLKNYFRDAELVVIVINRNDIESRQRCRNYCRIKTEEKCNWNQLTFEHGIFHKQTQGRRTDLIRIEPEQKQTLELACNPSIPKQLTLSAKELNNLIEFISGQRILLLAALKANKNTN